MVDKKCPAGVCKALLNYYIDADKCIGCGVCTTKCEFDAIHLYREHPECSKMMKAEDKMKGILPYMLKREFKIRFTKKEQ